MTSQVKDMHLHYDIEQLSLQNWPAVQTTYLDGWELRSSNGYTKRANCVSTLHSGNDHIDIKINQCEQYYNDLKQPTVFKLTPFSEPALDEKLQQLDYALEDPSYIFCMNLEQLNMSNKTSMNLVAEGQFVFYEHISLTWIDEYITVSKASPAIARSLVDVMAAIQGKLICCTYKVNDEPVAVAMAVIDQGYISLYHVHTATEYRNQGFAQAIITQLLIIGKKHGAHTSYLAVLKNNPPAQHLYHKLGYTELYPYWYRIKASSI